MLLKKLILKNFKSHKYSEINFTKGIIIIVGENGVGKSSILEGITYALFKKSNLNQNELINLNESKMSVSLFFEENGLEYKVIRTNSITASTSKLYKKINGEFVLFVEGNSEVNKALTSIIDVDLELFLNAIYIRQGEIANLISKKPAERKKLITKFLKIDNLEKAWEKIPTIINNYEHNQERINGMMIAKNDIKTELSENKLKLVDLKTELDNYLNDKEELDNKKSIIIKQKKALEDKKFKYLSLSNQIDNNKIELKNLKRNLNDKEKKYNQILDDEIELKNIKATIDEMEKYDYSNMVIEIKSENKSLELNNKSLSKSLNELLSVNNKCPICQSEISDEQKEKLISDYEKNINTNVDKINKNNLKIKEYNDKINAYEKYIFDYKRMKNNITNKKSIYDEIVAIKKEISKYEMEIKEKEKQLKYFIYDESKYFDVINDEKEINGLINVNLENTGILKGQIESMNIRINKLNNELLNMKKLNNEVDNLKQYIEILKDFRLIFGKDGVQKFLRKSVKNNIEANTNLFFKNFNFDYDGLAINDEFEVSLFENDNEINMNMLSGGERIAIALALRLGITETVAQGNIDCIFLDEPTIHLDAVRIEELNNILFAMNVIPQMIIVTHNDKLENLADVLIKVEKNNGISKVIYGGK